MECSTREVKRVNIDEGNKISKKGATNEKRIITSGVPTVTN